MQSLYLKTTTKKHAMSHPMFINITYTHLRKEMMMYFLGVALAVSKDTSVQCRRLLYFIITEEGCELIAGWTFMPINTCLFKVS